MASVAICPHCYLQLVVPDGVDTDECVECPTCAKEFALGQAVMRAIPEVVRRARAVEPVEPAREALDYVVGSDKDDVGEDNIDEVVEVDEIVLAADDAERDVVAAETATQDNYDESDVIAQIRARIEAEIAAKGLTPGTSSLLPLDVPVDDGEDRLELMLESERPAENPADWFRNAKTLDEIPAIELPDRRDEEVEERIAADGRVNELPDLEMSDLDISSEVGDALADEAEPTLADFATDSDLAPEPIDFREPKPTVRTLADLMPPEEIAADGEPADEIEEVTGPSFELPDVPLVPTSGSSFNGRTDHGSTIEFDSSMSFGPAAETEFELDDVDLESVESARADAESDDVGSDDSDSADLDSVDFESMGAKEAIADEFVPEEADIAEEAIAADAEPVFREPQQTEMPAAPFVLPALPRPRRKRSVVRTLVGVVAGGVFGVVAALYALLLIRGPEGDLLQIAEYIPSAILPSSFDQSATPIADAGRRGELPSEPAADTEPATTGESANIPAGYVEESVAPSQPLADEGPLSDERYDTEPAPLEEPVADPIGEHPVAAAAVPLPVRGPKFSTAQLAAALDAGKAALPGLTTGDLNDPAVRRTKGMSFAKLCDLAQALTFVDRSNPTAETGSAIADADRLFRETLSGAHTRGEVTRIAEIWISSPHRTHGGVFLASPLRGGQIAGDVYEYETSLDDGSGGKVALLMREPLDPMIEGTDQAIGIVGTIVDHPANDVAGYQGTAKRAIWAAATLPLE